MWQKKLYVNAEHRFRCWLNSLSKWRRTFNGFVCNWNSLPSLRFLFRVYFTKVKEKSVRSALIVVEIRSLAMWWQIISNLQMKNAACQRKLPKASRIANYRRRKRSWLDFKRILWLLVINVLNELRCHPKSITLSDWRKSHLEQ